MIAIVDYGMGNTGSIRNMFSRLGVQASLVSDPDALAGARGIVLPGVGSFDTAMDKLRQQGFVDPLTRAALDRRVPILGICLGVQLFCQRSEEGSGPGLGWLEAEVVRFRIPSAEKLTIPHMGWNTINVQKPSPILDDRFAESRFYFVHSYHLQCRNPEDVLATATYGYPFTAAIARGNLMGTQFHPEKSHKHGLRLLKNFATWVRSCAQG